MTNLYKSFKCTVYNRFFELNLYEKDPVNEHHWRTNIARPAGKIDLPAVVAGISAAPVALVVAAGDTAEGSVAKVGGELGSV